MPRGIRRTEEELLEAATPLGVRLVELMTARRLTSRGLSTSAGLGVDGVRNILRGKSKRPSKASLKALADVLEVPVSALEFPADPMPPLNPNAAATAFEPPTITVPEVALEDWTSGMALEALTPVYVWRLPAELVTFASLVTPIMVQAPNQVGEAGIVVGSRILVNVYPRARQVIGRAGQVLPGPYLLPLGGGLVLARVSPVEGKPDAARILVEEEAPNAPDDREVEAASLRPLGRVMGRVRIG